ncbi:MAG: hypothetical protein AAF550_15205, partial [Myxococcota bacterium]
VGAGQSVERDYSESSPMDLAGTAAKAAILNSGGDRIADAIDTIAFVKLFSDSAPIWACKLGRSSNPPESVARRIGAKPRDRIYSETCGSVPQTLLIEAFADLQAGRRECVLLCGAEAIKNQRHAERNTLPLDWNENHEAKLQDRGFGPMVVSPQELHNGLPAPIYYYSLMEDFRRQSLGFSTAEYLRHECELLMSLNEVAASNPYAQFPAALSSDDLLGAEHVTQIYTKRMVAQDSVNQGAALLLTTVEKARQLGIGEENWVYMHGAAYGMEHFMSVRPDPGRSPIAEQVVRRSLAMAGIDASELSLLDIYSCFPVAVTAVADALQRKTDGVDRLTLTGGLAYFGGPGNNYAMHSLAEMWSQVRLDPVQYGYVHANGGMLSKHSGGVFSCRPSKVDWSQVNTVMPTDDQSSLELEENPVRGTALAHCVHYRRGEPAVGVLLATSPEGKRFACRTAKDDLETVGQLVAEDPVGHKISVTPGPNKEHELNFRLD